MIHGFSIIELIEVLQVSLWVYAFYKIFIHNHEHKRSIIFTYGFTIVLFSVLKLGIYKPDFWSIVEALSWWAVNIGFICVIILLIKIEKDGEPTHINQRV